MLPANWSVRCEPCPKCGRRVVFISVDGSSFPIDVDFAYKKKTAPRGCRVTVNHGTLCAAYRREEFGRGKGFP